MSAITETFINVSDACLHCYETGYWQITGGKQQFP